MKQPTPKARPSLDFNECTRYIEAKYKINTRDYAHSNTQVFEWFDSVGKGQLDPEEKTRANSTIWYAEFKHAVSTGEIIERPYQDFWHWLIDVCDIHRGATMELYEGIDETAEPWQKEILELYLKEFGRGPYLTDW